MAPYAARLLDGLPPEQAAAVQHRHGPLLLFAGPGAGKTKTLTHRIAWLLASRQAVPAEILAVTFTVRAAGEMRLRLTDMLGPDGIRGLTVATFHSVCARLLRQHPGTFGRGEDFTIYDETDLTKAINFLLSDNERADIQQQLALHGQPPAGEVLNEISLAKNRLWEPQHYRAYSRHPVAELIATLWDGLEAELRSCNAFCFDDLLFCGAALLRDHPALLT